ncbi:MAG: FG-GAP repeat protein, partial [Chloroflexi bacterium]|nr:FG-GAP repeat protein [Chloroflexota bacterium]
MAKRTAIVVLCAVLCSTIWLLPSAGATLAPPSSTDVSSSSPARAVDMPPAAVQAGLSPHAWARIAEQIRADLARSAVAQDVSALAFTEQKKLTASDGAFQDFFGTSVAIWGDTVVVGAYYADVGGNPDQGAAYIFYRNQGGAENWGQVKKITASDGAAYDEFGRSVAIYGDTVVVGASEAAVGGNPGQGAAYLFRRNQGGAENWGQVKKLTASDGAVGDQFGISVAIWGDTVVVGADRDDVGANANQGSAYIFYRNQGGAENWGQVKELLAPTDAGVPSVFGQSVAIYGDTVVVGAYQAAVGGVFNYGAAYVFARNQGGAENWGQVKKLVASDGTEGDRFGISVAIWGDTVVVGAYLADVGSNSGQG